MIIDATERFLNESRRRLDVAGLAEDYGAQARQALESHEGLLEPDVKKRLAANFAAIVDRFSIKPRHLTYSVEASSDSALRRDLSRLTNTESPNIPARTLKWRQYIKLVADALIKRGEPVSEEWLYHRLTLGTEFHHKAFASTDPDLLVAGYETLTMDIDAEFGLLAAYRQIAKLQVQRESPEWTPELLQEMAEHLPAFSILFDDLKDWIPVATRDEFALHSRNFVESSREEQAIILQLVEHGETLARAEAEDKGEIFLSMKTLALRRYLHAVDPNLALWEYEPAGGSFSPVFVDEYQLEWLPHCLLGWGSLFPDMDLSGAGEVKQSIDDDGILRQKAEQGWDPYVGYVYLVLYPSMDMSRLAPQLMFKGNDFSELNSVYSLTVDMLMLSAGRYLPADPGRLRESQEWCTLFDLLQDTWRIRDCLKISAANIDRHPLLVAEREAAVERRRDIDLLFEYDNPATDRDGP